MVNQAVDRRRRHHRVLEDRFPARERQVARQHHAATLVALGQQAEQHLHLVTALLYVAQIIQDQDLVPREALEITAQLQVPLGRQEVLDHQPTVPEIDPPSRTDQFVRDRR